MIGTWLKAFWLAIAAILFALLAPTPTTAQPAGSLGVLSLNLGGIDDPISWETRSERIAAWAQRKQLVPDVIALQEVHGMMLVTGPRSCGRGFGVGAGDYDQLDILLKDLSQRLGVVYRIAYLTGKYDAYGLEGFAECVVYSAQAVLYNPTRLFNVTAWDAAASQPHDAADNLHGVPHRRRSLPLCFRGTRLMPIETLIDGPPQTDRCGRDTPSGPTWAVMRDQGILAASFARLALANDPSKTIDIFNVHLTASQELADWGIVTRLIGAVPAPQDAGLSRYYPPVLIGDFNSLANQGFPGFVNVFGPIPHPTVPGEVDPVVASVGREESFPAQYRARVAERLPVPELSPSVACPGGVDIQVSDHCGLFIRLEWDGTEAGALRQSSSRVRAT